MIVVGAPSPTWQHCEVTVTVIGRLTIPSADALTDAVPAPIALMVADVPLPLVTETVTTCPLVVLQVTLGPVLEEVVFRGYLFTLLAWSFHRLADSGGRNRLVVVATAVAFALVHMSQPGVSWLQLACITSTGTLYGWLRSRSASVAPAAASHAAYNLTLYGVAGVVAALSGRSSAL